MATRQRSKAESIYQLKITLKDSRPPIWRRVLVRDTETLEHLHWVIQLSMGWTNSHLHSFEIHGHEYGMVMPELDLGGMAITDERTVPLRTVIPPEKFKFSYLYDFGDAWDHSVVVEKVLAVDPDTDYPVCIKGKRACPPEDCGGVWGYQDVLDALQEPDHPEHNEMLEWVGGAFDPEDADIEGANARLQQMDMFKRLSMRA